MAQVLPPHSVVADQSVAEWTVEYFKWQWLQPTNQNPAFDSDGSRANNGQSGPVFFVTGGFYSGPQRPRHYTVPEGKYLLIPLLTIEVENIDITPARSAEQLRDIAAEIIDTTVELRAVVDGVSVPGLFAYRERAPLFSLFVDSADNLLSYGYQHPVVGLIDPIVVEGYWLMLAPLRPGTHSIIFGGTYGPPNDYSYERTDFITVIPIPLTQRVEELISLLQASNLGPKLKRTLTEQLRAAREDFARNHLRGGIEDLRDFQKKARRGLATTDQSLADQLSDAAQQIIDRAVAQIHTEEGKHHENENDDSDPRGHNTL